MKYKIRFIKVHFFEHKALEAYFKMMAEKGWRIYKISNFYMLFERIEPASLHFHIGFNPKYSSFKAKIENDEKSDYREVIEDFNYQFLCAYRQMQIFSSEAPAPSFKEPDRTRKSFNKIIFKREFSDNFMPLVAVVILFFLYTLMITPYNLAINGYIFLFGIMSLVLLCRIFDLIPYLRYLISKKESTDSSIIIHRFDPTIPLGIILLFSLLVSRSNTIYIFLFLLAICLVLAKILYDILLFFSLTKLKLARIFSLSFGCLLLGVLSFFSFQSMEDSAIKQNDDYFLNEITSQMKEYDFHSFEESILMSIETVYTETFAYDYYDIKPTIMKSFCMNTVLQSLAERYSDFSLVNGGGYEYFAQEGEYPDTIIVSNNKILVINQLLSKEKIHDYAQRLAK